MSDPKERQEQNDDLDLEAETVRDLELDDETAAQLQGGFKPMPTQSGEC